MNRDIRRPLEKLLHQEGVERVVLGPSHSCRHSHTVGRLEYRRDIDVGILVRGYSGDGVHDLFVYIRPEKVEDVKEYLENIR